MTGVNQSGERYNGIVIERRALCVACSAVRLVISSPVFIDSCFQLSCDNGIVTYCASSQGLLHVMNLLSGFLLMKLDTVQ